VESEELVEEEEENEEEEEHMEGESQHVDLSEEVLDVAGCQTLDEHAASLQPEIGAVLATLDNLETLHQRQEEVVDGILRSPMATMESPLLPEVEDQGEPMPEPSEEQSSEEIICHESEDWPPELRPAPPPSSEEESVDWPPELRPAPLPSPEEVEEHMEEEPKEAKRKAYGSAERLKEHAKRAREAGQRCEDLKKADQAAKMSEEAALKACKKALQRTRKARDAAEERVEACWAAGQAGLAGDVAHHQVEKFGEAAQWLLQACKCIEHGPEAPSLSSDDDAE